MLLVLAAMTIPFSYDGSLRPGQTLEVRDINGSVRVHTGDRLSIHAIKQSERGDANAVAIHVENHPSGIVVCVRYPPNASRGCDESSGSQNSDNNDTSVAFDITVPHGITLDAHTLNGSIDAVNDGPTMVETVNGSVHVQGRTVRTAKTVNGSVEVTMLDRGSGTLDAHSVNGSISVTLPSGSGVSLVARTVTGGITADGFTIERPRYGPGAHASGTVGDGARKLDLETMNGSITVRR
jgi:hypothetical protein